MKPFVPAAFAVVLICAPLAADELRTLDGKSVKGELVDRARAVATVFGLARRERDAWVQWPARVAALMAAELRIDPHQMETVLEKHVRRHLAELSDVRVELR